MTTPKSYTVPSGVAAANFLRSGMASRPPTPKIYECDRTLDNVPRTVHLDEICRGFAIATFCLARGEREIEFVEIQILRHGRSFGHDLEWVLSR